MPADTQPQIDMPLRVTPVEKAQTGDASASKGINGSNGVNGSNGSTTADNKYDPHFTDAVINATGPKAAPRTRKVIGNLIRHLHDFCRENEITVDEWMAAVDFVRPLPCPALASTPAIR